MPTTPRLRRCLVVVTVGTALAVAGSGCAKDHLDERDVRAVCLNLGAGGWAAAVAVAREAGIPDEAGAEAAVRQAARDTCPAYADRVEG